MLNERTRRNGLLARPSDVVVRYWGRKSPEIARRYISQYSKTGEVVADFFGGSGVFIRTALAQGRRALYIDLNPFAYLIARSAVTQCDPSEFLGVATRLISNLRVGLKRGMGSTSVEAPQLFQMRCKCGERVEIASITYSRRYKRTQKDRITFKGNKAAVLRDIPSRNTIQHQTIVALHPELQTDVLSALLDSLIREGFVTETEFPLTYKYSSKCICGRIGGICPKKFPWILRGDIIPRDWYPKDKLQYADGTYFLKQRDVVSVSDLFTPRNLATLSSIWKSIKKVPGTREVKACLELTFMSALAGSSKMCRIGGGPWPVNSYWIPRTFVTRNPIIAFQKAIRRVFRMLTTRNAVKVGTINQLLAGHVQASFLCRDATIVRLPRKKLDYVIIDPPHSGEVQFFELSLFYTSWIRRKLSFARELTINSRRRLSLDTYLERIELASKRIYDSLRADGHYTVILHTRDVIVLRECLDAILKARFELEDKQDHGDYRVFTFHKYIPHVVT